VRYRLARAVQRELGEDRQRDRPDLSRVARYHEGLGAPAGAAVVDEATWKDLDLDEVFVSLDRTESQVGRQYLYHLLRSPQDALEPLTRLETATRKFGNAEHHAREARASLRQLAEPRSAHLAELLFGDIPARPRFWWLFPLMTASAFVCFALLFVWPKILVLWLVLSAANIAAQLYYRPRVRKATIAFQAVPDLVRVAQQLSALNDEGIAPEVAVLRDGAAKLALLRRATSWLLFEPGATNELVSTLYEYVNLLFLIDINAFVFSAQRISDARPLLREVFAAIGRIDAAQSIAAWRRSLSQYAVPEFTAPAKTLMVEGLYHPLLKRPVANSLHIEQSSVLITGSNMSGKTTFMRTVGVNAILAQTLHTTCAKRWCAPFFSVRTSIGRADSLLDGTSHYLAEVESVYALISAKRADRQHLYILDEMFRGTNTPERVAAAYAVLGYLTRGNDIVVVATHDIELLPLLKDSYQPYHFRESIEGDALMFDYQLRAGASSSRNAIALLRLMRYPDDLVADAVAALDASAR